MNVYYLVRHAHADWSEDENRSLSQRGQEGARRIVDFLAAFPISQIYASPYARAIQTIAPLAHNLNLEIRTTPELRERQLGEFTNGDFFTAVQATWNGPEFAHPGGESNRAAQERARSFVNRVQTQNENKHIVLSTHGNLMALLLNSFERSIDFAFWRSLTMPDVYTLTIQKSERCDINR